MSIQSTPRLKHGHALTTGKGGATNIGMGFVVLSEHLGISEGAITTINKQIIKDRFIVEL